MQRYHQTLQDSPQKEENPMKKKNCTLCDKTTSKNQQHKAKLTIPHIIDGINQTSSSSIKAGTHLM